MSTKELKKLYRKVEKRLSKAIQDYFKYERELPLPGFDDDLMQERTNKCKEHLNSLLDEIIKEGLGYMYRVEYECSGFELADIQITFLPKDSLPACCRATIIVEPSYSEKMKEII